MTGGEVVSLIGVSHAYPAAPPVLRGADLGVGPGSRVALLGANGSGKSTLLRCLSGALRPDGGRVEVHGVALDYSRTGLRRHRQTVQLVTQDPDDQLFSASVAADVSFGPMNLGLAEAEVRRRVAEALDLLGVTSLRDRPTHHLSFGERKRVAIAGAVAMRPEVLALDEPTAGLDPAAVQETMAALERLRAAGTAVVLATHDVDLALAWADHLAVVTAGTVRQGAPAVLLGDTRLLAQARLRRAWVLSVLDRLVAVGGVAPGAHARTEAEIVELVGRRARTDPPGRAPGTPR